MAGRIYPKIRHPSPPVSAGRYPRISAGESDPFQAWCEDLESLLIGTCMRLMLCPPSLDFHGFSIPQFDWNCIDDKYVLLVHVYISYSCSRFLSPFSFWKVAICVCRTKGRCLYAGLWKFVPLPETSQRKKQSY